ncbi:MULTISPECIES: hypothetical protein [unclassified Mesorhizobium]|uniref:PIN-like domain-containing protein n=1 Tax=unclassified Mesorhizobium TaxID=325217 RepID=UPI0003CE4518|nr:hypothetical protein [Mesorhizobium sp. LSJC269B00]ESW90559.1 hypothetical protein X770_09005 [Mesorhizobium sp. LSJC269B00]
MDRRDAQGQYVWHAAGGGRPRLARPDGLCRVALAAFLLGRHWPDYSTICRDGQGGAICAREWIGADVAWIGQLSTEGRWIVISGDRRITRNKVEYAAFRSSRLVGFFLSKGLYKAPVVKQMERLLALWCPIEKQSEIVAGGAMFELPIKSTRIEQLKV